MHTSGKRPPLGQALKLKAALSADKDALLNVPDIKWLYQCLYTLDPTQQNYRRASAYTNSVVTTSQQTRNSGCGVSIFATASLLNHSSGFRLNSLNGHSCCAEDAISDDKHGQLWILSELW